MLTIAAATAPGTVECILQSAQRVWTIEAACGLL
jgi:hypothetical protein